MRRDGFLSALAAGAVAPLLPSLGQARPTDAPDVNLPAVFRGGRPFLKLTAPDGSSIMTWLDTDGAGFISEVLATRLRLVVHGGRAALPQVAEQLPPLQGDGTLPLLDPPPSEAILAGVDMQLGGTWFAQRVWSIDYRNEQITWYPSNKPITDSATNRAKFTLEHDLYPIVPVVVGEAVYPMALDTAASIADAKGHVTATSFISHALFAKLHAAHPEWETRTHAPGIDGILVPQVRIANVAFGDALFTTRPDDDVFEGETVSGKIGSDVWAFRILMLDYVRGIAAFD